MTRTASVTATATPPTTSARHRCSQEAEVDADRPSRRARNVLGYSGTNSKYVNIHHTNFYNNGAGVVPNTLDSEKFEPTSTGIIEKNNIFWNNFNYFLPGSPVKTFGGLARRDQLPDRDRRCPFRCHGWKVRENQIFGNFKWGSASVLQPILPKRGRRRDKPQQPVHQQLEWAWGHRSQRLRLLRRRLRFGQLLLEQLRSASTRVPSPSATLASLYPDCPAPAPPASGTGTSTGNADLVGIIFSYVLSDPASTQECSWTSTRTRRLRATSPLSHPGAVCP